MEKWFIPITLLPGVGLFLLSTSNLLIALTKNISELMKEGATETLIRVKLSQLTLISRAMIFFYISVGFLILGGLLGGLLSEGANTQTVMLVLTLIGILFLLIAAMLMIIYAYRAVGIRKWQLEEMLALEREKDKEPTKESLRPH